MNKRVGYFGLSSPTYYDYSQKLPRTRSDTFSTPNPIIEGAFGAMLLYDELVFLCPSLCPANMRSLPYVRFLDQGEDIPVLSPDSIPAPEDVFFHDTLQEFAQSSDRYAAVRELLGITWKASPDNHTHGLSFNGVTVSANSWQVEKVLLDLQVVRQLEEEVELITNSFTGALFRPGAQAAVERRFTELLVLKDVPNYLTPYGPYHDCIEEVRNSPFLTDFRSWVVKTGAPPSAGELKARKHEVERKLTEAQRAVFLKYLNPKSGYKALAETMVGVGLDFVPGGSALKNLYELGGQWKEERAKQRLRWQGFVLAARAAVEDGLS